MTVSVRFLLLALLPVGLVACGGGGGGPKTLTGVFVDDPVQGLRYQTATQSGTTDAQGRFRYRSGQTVSFRVDRKSVV